jgi:hypothetical protein
VLDAARRFESKAHSHDLFAEICQCNPAVAAPPQIVMSSVQEAASTLAVRATAGATSIVKSEYGVGGSRTVVVHPDQAPSEPVALQLLYDLISDDNIFLSRALVTASTTSLPTNSSRPEARPDSERCLWPPNLTKSGPDLRPEGFGAYNRRRTRDASPPGCWALSTTPQPT